MSRLLPVVTDDYGARTLARLIRGGGDISDAGPTSTIAAPRSTVVVEIIKDIDADDYRQHDARLLELVADDWIDTKQTVKIRNLSFAALAAETKAIAEPVSRWGLCVAKPGLEVRWGILSQDSGQDDQLISVEMYAAADIEEFEAGECGTAGSGSGSGSGSGGADNAFLDMTFSFCDAIGSGSGSGSGSGTGSTLALVPAGYKAGPVGMIKMPICSAAGSGSGSGGSGSGSGSGAEWEGWVVIFGRRMRCVAEIPYTIECCPVEGLKITQWNRIWYFGGALSPRLDPCEEAGSGSGS